MRITRHEHDDLPPPLREGLQALKQDERILSTEVQARLSTARQLALARHADANGRASAWDEVLSLSKWGHARMASMAAFSILFTLGLIMFSHSQNDDALLLSDDMPVEAFVDDGFFDGQYSENI